MSNDELRAKMEALDIWIEKVENWVFNFDNKLFLPPSMEIDDRYFGFKHENIVIFAYVQLLNIGNISKIIRVGSDKYRLTEVPEDLHGLILDAFFSMGTDILNPGVYLEDSNGKLPKIRYEALWEPPGDYIKELIEKRNFMLDKNFEALKPLLTKIYDGAGVEAPQYISGKPVINVPESVH